MRKRLEGAVGGSGAGTQSDSRAATEASGPVRVKNLVPENVLRTKGEELNQQRVRLEAKHRAIEGSGLRTTDLEAVRLRLPEIAAKLHRWVMEIAEDDMELVLRALQVQVLASREEIRIEGSVPVIAHQEEDLVTIVQTSG